MEVVLAHEPAKCLPSNGAVLVTSATRDKLPLFSTPEKLAAVQRSLFTAAEDSGWRLQAWALFANHVHFVVTPDGPAVPDQEPFESAFQALSTAAVNCEEGTKGRSVWFRSWRTRLTFESSFLARVSYVHNNAVRHGLVEQARDYPWCSATWFEDTAPRPFARKVMGLRTNRVHVVDDF